MNTFWEEFFCGLCFIALFIVLPASALTYLLIEWEGFFIGFKIISLVLLWSFVGSAIVVFCFPAFWTLFSRTIVTIKPDGDQENNLQVITIGPFNRYVTHV